ncbi:predicted protein [Lichtheimia corymbifera JMRC:FSU:9682]|uniref:Uncharacterized protein n=1 Tax=Lichtheimia corymbifera JMRC:FSU:9682 TaxID=1263082 RepID=A0A068S0A6_9FUNG|nr:predicted protein [Lichtheimia corymbifera JMRC:FSU:9682]
MCMTRTINWGQASLLPWALFHLLAVKPMRMTRLSIWHKSSLSFIGGDADADDKTISWHKSSLSFIGGEAMRMTRLSIGTSPFSIGTSLLFYFGGEAMRMTRLSLWHKSSLHFVVGEADADGKARSLVQVSLLA